VKKAGAELAAAFQFLTRLPVPASQYTPDLLGRAAKFFPLVGLVIGVLAAVVHNLAARWWGVPLGALATLTFLVLITGGFHEDALADAADGFGGGWSRERVLEIMRDSRIGSYGGIAIGLSLLWRYVLLASLPEGRFAVYLVTAHVLCRWTALPLSYALRPARTDGASVIVAQQTSRTDLAFGSMLALAIVFTCLRSAAWIPLLATVLLVLVSGWYYRQKLGGVTGDCFGATNQISEIAVYFCGCTLARF
jgi:adenosylcobinamide-GDP ribazoletransferase